MTTKNPNEKSERAICICGHQLITHQYTRRWGHKCREFRSHTHNRCCEEGCKCETPTPKANIFNTLR